MERKIALLIAFVITVTELGAQNARFSQIGSAPLHLNPSLSGRFDGKARVSSLFSWQKSEMAFMPHQSLNLDIKLGKYQAVGDAPAFDPLDTAQTGANARQRKTKRDAKERTYSTSMSNEHSKGYWSVGLNYYQYGNDFTGIYQNTSPLRASFYSVHAARHFYLPKNKYWGIGAQATYARGKLDETRGINYDKEISGGAFRYSNRLASNRISTNDYFDYNIGAYYGINTEQIGFEVGLAMHHLFYPKNDIFAIDDETALRHRMTLHSVLRFKVAPKWGILQKNMYWAEGLYWRSTSFYDSVHIISLWSGVELYKTDPKSRFNFNAGFYTRSFRTLMPILNISLGPVVDFRYSFEFPINSDRFNAYTAERTELALLFTLNKRTATGTRFYKKFNYW